MKVGRNDTCPCGSGRKFKRCCGEARSALPPPVQQATRKRACNGCTACCDGWLKIEIDGAPVYPGKPCPHSTGKGCRIYESRPEDPCRNFICGWLEEGSPFPEDFRPDRLGVIVLRARWRRQTVFALVPAGLDPDAGLVEWMTAFSNANGTPLLYQVQGEWYGHGPAELHRDLLAKKERGELLWSGSNYDITPVSS
jgi:hypothetical protein